MGGGPTSHVVGRSTLLCLVGTLSGYDGPTCMANLIAMIELANLSLAVLPLPHLHVPQESHDVGSRAEASVQQQRSVGPKRPCNGGGRVATTVQFLLGSERCRVGAGMNLELRMGCNT